MARAFVAVKDRDDGSPDGPIRLPPTGGVWILRQGRGRGRPPSASFVAVGAVVAIVALIGISATAATYFGLSGRIKSARQALEAAQADQRTLDTRVADAENKVTALARERDELEHRHRETADQLEGARTGLDDERRHRREVEDEVQALRDRLEDQEASTAGPEAAEADPEADGAPTEAETGLEADGSEDEASEAVSTGTSPGPAAAPVYPEADGCWALLLADVTRRWAAVVGAPPELRRTHLGAVPDQLNEALTREIDRLREEVGVDISFRAGAMIEPADPVVFLLAAAHLLGELAAGCQRVTVELDGELVLTGDEWIGPIEDLQLARERTLAAGAPVDSLTIEETAPEPDGDGSSDVDGGDGSGSATQASWGELDEPNKPTYRVRLAMQAAG